MTLVLQDRLVLVWASCHGFVCTRVYTIMLSNVSLNDFAKLLARDSVVVTRDGRAQNNSVTVRYATSR